MLELLVLTFSPFFTESNNIFTQLIYWNNTLSIPLVCSHYYSSKGWQPGIKKRTPEGEGRVGRIPHHMPFRMVPAFFTVHMAFLSPDWTARGISLSIHNLTWGETLYVRRQMDCYAPEKPIPCEPRHLSFTVSLSHVHTLCCSLDPFGKPAVAECSEPFMVL